MGELMLYKPGFAGAFPGECETSDRREGTARRYARRLGQGLPAREKADGPTGKAFPLPFDGLRGTKNYPVKMMDPN